ncbi:MAG: LPS-assembly protein LptD [Hyphomicrobiaceae bacterium]
MRHAETQQAAPSLPTAWALPGRLGRVALALLAALLLAVIGPKAGAQDPSVLSQPGVPQKKGSFPAPKGGILGGPVQKIDKAKPLYLQGDDLIYDTKNNRVIARGNVEIYYNDYALTADQVIYDQGANTLTAQGNVQIKEPNGNIVRAERFDATADFRDAFIQSLSAVTKDETRIVARRAVRKDANVTEFEQGKFTPCKSDPGKPPLWCISAARIVHDQQAATITYQDAQFELFGVPILYMPFFTHADPSVKRRTGFLIPEYGNSTTLGWTVETPYYFALSPYYDFTFNPMYTSKHGVLYQGHWRQRVAIGDVRGEYYVKLAGIDQNASTLPDDLTPAKRRLLDGWRGSIESKGTFSLSSWWRAGWDVTIESDDTFRRFYKLDSVLQTDRVNMAYIQGLSDRNHFGMTLYHFGGLLVEDTPVSESRVHPVIDYNYIVNQPVFGGELSFNGNMQSLSRSDGSDMTRVSADAQWRRKLIDSIGQVWTPFASARADITRFSNANDPNNPTLTTPEDEIVRAMGAVGITYSYPFVARSQQGSHVAEPIAQVIARPASVSQRRIPDEDAKSLYFDDTLLFDTDKFSGWDRIETGTRANVGVQYTFQANTGGYARLIAGQSFHLAGENPYTNPGIASGTTTTGTVTGTTVSSFSPRSGLETDRSDYVLGAYLAPIQAFRVVAQSRFDEVDLSLRRQDVFATVSVGPVSLTGQYSYTREDPAIGLLSSEQDFVGVATLKLTDRWALTGMVRYDIDQSMRLQDMLQLRYSDECFVLTASLTESFITDPTRDIKPDRSVMLRFEWKHLGEFKYKTDKLDHIFADNQPVK